MFGKTLQPLFGFLGIEGLQFEIQIDCLANLTGWLSTSPVLLVHFDSTTYFFLIITKMTTS
jgi:hypothetical protein